MIWGWRSESWGLPHGAGWLRERAMMLSRMTAALNVYAAVKAWRDSHDWAQFVIDRPALWDIVSRVLELREIHG